MIITITITLAVLVAINFLLLAFSCNKTTKKHIEKKTVHNINQKTTIPQPVNQLAPTGS